MALIIKSVYYNTVHLSTVHDLQLLSDELKVLIINGYKVSLDVSARNTLSRQPWGGSTTTLPPTPGTRYSFGEYEPLAPYNVSSSTESETTSCQPSSLPPAPRMKYYYGEREPYISTEEELVIAESSVV